MRAAASMALMFLSYFCASGAQIVSLEIEIQEAWQDKPQSYIIADYEKVNLIIGEENQVFLGSTSMLLRPFLTDFSTLQIRADFYGLPPNIQPVFKQIALKKNQVLEILESSGKPGRIYKIIFKNWEVSKQEITCLENTYDTSLWASDFSVHFNFHFIKHSRADYLWNYNQAYLENEFDRIRKFYDVYPLTKLEFYYHHCLYPKLNWNQGLGIALFPAKKEVHILFGPETNTLDSPHLHIFMLLNQWGYAPLFMTYGLSGFFTLNHYYTKKSLEQKKLIPLDGLFSSASFRRQDQEAAYFQAASWVRYLMERFSPEKVIAFYKEVSEINVRGLTERYFGKIEQLEADWLDYLKKYWPAGGELDFFAKISTALRKYKEALILYQDLDRDFPEHQTSVDLGQAYYLLADYFQAVINYQKWVSQDSLNPDRRYALGNMYWLKGDTVLAKQKYEEAIALDSNFGPAYLNLAGLSFDQKQYQRCQSLLEKLASFEMSPEEEIEYYLARTDYHQSLGQEILADSTALKARQLGKNFVRKYPEESLPYLLLGRAYLACDSVDQASSYLKVAQLLEDRAYYTGQVYLYLGKLFLKRGDQEGARSYFQEVLATPSGFREKRLAQEILKNL